MNRIRKPQSRSMDFTRLTKTDLKKVAKYITCDIHNLRWNAKKKKLFVNGELFLEGSQEMAELKQEVWK